MDLQHKTYDQKNEIQDIKDVDGKFLILHNDDYHTFEYVIDALITICNHDEEQAVQCTYLVHYKGKADVKKGSYDELKPMMNGLRSKDLKATIE
jgi:ATP-dependent Clp protease adaptor protein ClpS